MAVTSPCPKRECSFNNSLQQRHRMSIVEKSHHHSMPIALSPIVRLPVGRRSLRAHSLTNIAKLEAQTPSYPNGYTVGNFDSHHGDCRRDEERQRKRKQIEVPDYAGLVQRVPANHYQRQNPLEHQHNPR